MMYLHLSPSVRRGNKSSGLQNIERQLYRLFLEGKHIRAREIKCLHTRALLRAWKNTTGRECERTIACTRTGSQASRRIARRSDSAAPETGEKARMKIANRRLLIECFSRDDGNAISPIRADEIYAGEARDLDNV